MSASVVESEIIEKNGRLTFNVGVLIGILSTIEAMLRANMNGGLAENQVLALLTLIEERKGYVYPWIAKEFYSRTSPASGGSGEANQNLIAETEKKGSGK